MQLEILTLKAVYFVYQLYINATGCLNIIYLKINMIKVFTFQRVSMLYALVSCGKLFRFPTRKSEFLCLLNFSLSTP
jgi:hypothetical protein